VIQQIAAAEAEIGAAALRSVLEIPAVLSGVVTILQNVQSSAQSCASQERDVLRERIKLFRSKLFLFSAAMDRSSSIFEGYSRHAAVSSGFYGPGGASSAGRDPAFFNLIV
jgi:hypothetical protein